MPFGVKPDPAGGPPIDFDRIYEAGIRPGIEDAELTPVRADAEILMGIIHKPMFERLLLCDYAVADLTSANPNVFYELGVRHAVRPRTTLPVIAAGQKIPFDLGLVRCLTYALDDTHGLGDAQAAELRRLVAERLRVLRAEPHAEACDSPLFQLLEGYPPPDISRLKTDVFRERVDYAEGLKRELAEARRGGEPDALHRIQERLGPLEDVEAGVVIDLMLSYRALSDWDAMVALCDAMPAALQRTVMVREQLGFALNRRGDREAAIEVLEGVIAQQGPSSETCGILGRVHKDRWQDALAEGRAALARGHLDRAIATYLRGFETDWRDAYPGVNAVTLLEVKGDPASLSRKQGLLPVVRYAVEQRIRGEAADYWDHATLLELAVLGSDEERAVRHLGDALAVVREAWEPRSTAGNLRLVRRARAERGAVEAWLDEVIAELEARAAS
ncbi:MAG: DUF4071 domain-containing protein [Deltaproteobacteria bacterium]|nr:DUF4071 domain-containing protein [Deltaproteobacteria bacterium]